ncbi:hypothetical protein F0562_025293 [Nyssa sinensis]|uniref:Uncharacterized protein n=1 Tax=Nyssa sinensis TaxID=561372 RepID=A0A5J5BGA8_9ASTE|nr:hypothetical protein F0562_025293 [Nyssa sinensis]
MGGIFFILTPDVIASFLRLPQVTHLYYPVLGPNPAINEVVASALHRDGLQVLQTYGNRLNHALMIEDYRFLNLVVSLVLSPLIHTNTLTPDSAQFLYAIGIRKSIDAPSHIFCYITTAITGTRRDALPFGSIKDDFLVEDLDQPYILDPLVLDPFLAPAPTLGPPIANFDHHYEQISRDFFLPVMALD